jgi:hypothetical protein
VPADQSLADGTAFEHSLEGVLMYALACVQAAS